MKYKQVTVKSFSPDSPFDPNGGSIIYWVNTPSMAERSFNINEEGLVQLRKGPSADFLFCNVFQAQFTYSLNSSTRYLLSYRDGRNVSPEGLGVMQYDTAFEIPPGSNRIDNGAEMSIILENASYQIKPEDNDLEIAITLNDSPVLLVGRLINRLSPITNSHMPVELQEDILFDVLQQWILSYLPEGRISAVKLIEVQDAPIITSSSTAE